MLKSIDDLGNTGMQVLLMRRTGSSTVKTDVGFRDATGRIRGWFAKNPPTHFCELPAWGSDAAAIVRQRLTK